MSHPTKLLLTMGFVLFVNAYASADTIYVKSGATGDGSSWASAYGLLQDALDAAVPDDEIWVAAGLVLASKIKKVQLQ